MSVGSSPAPLNVTAEARICAANAGVEDLVALMATYESRTTIDLRALCNLGHGTLKNHGDQTGTYATNLKVLDDHNVTANTGYVSVMPHGATTYISGLIDVVLDAVALYEAQNYVGMGSGVGTGNAAAEIAKAMVEAQERAKLESTTLRRSLLLMSRTGMLRYMPCTNSTCARMRWAIAMHNIRQISIWALVLRISILVLICSRTCLSATRRAVGRPCRWRPG